MTETKMCVLCQERPAAFDSPVACSECFLAFVGVFNAIVARRLEREATDTTTDESREST